MWSVIFLSVWSLLVLGTQSDVFTSMNRIKAMVLEEEQILDSLRDALVENNQEAVITEFYTRRRRQIHQRNSYLNTNQLAHPNMAYSYIKEFANEYQQLRKDILANSTPKLYTILSRIADEDDLAGAKVSLLRLQEVYDLNVTDMANGNYRNILGPPISAYDVYTIAQAAFLHGKLKQTVDWLTLALHMIQRPASNIDDKLGDVTTMASIPVPGNSPSAGGLEALLGRAYLRQNKRLLAEAYLKTSEIKDPRHGDVFLLRDELKTLNPDHFKEQPLIKELQNFHRLCSIQNKMTNTNSKSWFVCRYVHVFLPYYRFKEEIISESPFVSLFYDVVSDFEAEEVTSFSKEQLFRGGVVGSKGVETSGIRTSHIGFFDDKHSPIIRSISQRITYLTGLNTAISDKGFYSNKLSAAEPIQVVNYGIGGHYSVHMDPYEDRNSATTHILDNFGNRLATFLIYLTHVELGGSTAFPNIDLVVAPIKNSAVFWYSYSPNGVMDRRTRHAGCPVVVGEKWVTNKWILSYGQTFSRRCGLKKNASQLDIEEDMKRGYKPYRRRK